MGRAQGAKSIQDGGPDDAEYGTHNVTADLLFKVSGFSTEAAWAMREGADDTQRDFLELGSGFYVQPGYLLPKQPIGVTVRYGQSTAVDNTAFSEKTEVGPGLSWYIAGARNKMKLQTDYLRTLGVGRPLGREAACAPPASGHALTESCRSTGGPVERGDTQPSTVRPRFGASLYRWRLTLAPGL